MAQEDRGAGNNIPVAGIVALMLFASGLWVQHQPLQSDRPAAEAKALGPAHEGQDVQARLWQDPFDAVQRAEKLAREPSAAGAPRVSRAPEDLKKLIVEAGKGTLVLPVMVFGGPYAEDAEERRRNRYAVLAALRAANFEPVYGRGVGFVRFQAKHASLGGLVVPFEQWRPIEADGKARWERIFVLWLAEEVFSRETVKRLEALLSETVPHSSDVTVLGPAGKQAAQALAKDGRCMDGEGYIGVGGACPRFIAPRLTNPDVKSAVIRLSPDDEALVARLIQELRNRKLELPPPRPATPANCADHIALVVEADTHYARSLEAQFAKQLASCTGRLHVFRYFRGLDGKVAAVAEDAKKPTDGTRDRARQETTAPQERAQGQGQFDYLLRVAAEVRKMNDSLERHTRQGSSMLNISRKGRSIRAVVVLGSDIHDKLAILHALRERLPQALFATTDLDAGLLQAEQLAWTRNVIVASGYGFRLPDTVQGGAAPFRDSYQTATFAAARLAVAYPNDKDLLKIVNENRGQVRLFEIGNGVAVELVPTGGSAAVSPHRDNLVQVGIGLLLLGTFGCVFSWCVRGLLLEWRLLAVLAAVAAVAAYVFHMLSIADQPGEEPLLWLEGVSIWPSELIRVGVVLLAVAMGAYGWRSLRAGDAALEKEFFSDRKPTADRPIKRGVAAWLQCLFPLADIKATGASVDVQTLWDKYRTWTAAPCVAVRVGLGLALYLVLSFQLISIDPPVVPVRGERSFLLDQYTVMAAVISMLTLLLVILDRVAMSTLFLKRLYGEKDRPRPSNWPQKTLHRYCGCGGDVGARSYIDLRLSARLTQFVNGIVFYPFVLSLLLILARSRFFDNWTMPRGLLMVLAMGLGLVVISALSLRHYAKRILHHTVDRLAQRELVQSGSRRRGGATPEHLRKMREAAVNLREGAFAPLAEQPIIRALILPFGGAGLVSLLEYAAFMKS